MATTQPAGPRTDDGRDDDLPDAPEPLWRELLGRRLRWLRLQRGETLAETARRAGVSPQYLSEIERGIKEPSSEMVAAIAGALGTSLLDLTSAIAWELTAAIAAPAGVHRLAPARLLAPASAHLLASVRSLAPTPTRAATSATYALAA
ncbi:helix-turn-helix transcriptional regulator [Agrococcus sp. ARC_14]|uniref:helix-turn-helix domain-containing protein n=1 Tax=Agrococcus sp. ARC_14 TaxID=2919927 RepID=UPI001F0661CE|nr:helix-turn-helix transcriptional regulator [Agrococcus sp. ARC_14]MCH1881861.1 helix-turn-helix transcriptional regulator [Agrococcus sp. ARC_14]